MSNDNNALRGSGYSRMAIELSPIIAQDIEAEARHNGLRGIQDFFVAPDTWSPMYLREEAQFLAAVVDSRASDSLVKGRLPTWTAFVAHPSYDAYWRARDVRPQINRRGDRGVPTLVVGGRWDQEDRAAERLPCGDAPRVSLHAVSLTGGAAGGRAVGAGRRRQAQAGAMRRGSHCPKMTASRPAVNAAECRRRTYLRSIDTTEGVMRPSQMAAGIAARGLAILAQDLPPIPAWSPTP